MQKKIEVPVLSKELIEYLDVLYPDQCTDLNDKERHIFYKSGQRSVVQHLKEKYKIQQET